MVLGSFCYICHSAALCNGARGEICCAWSATCCFCYQYTPTPVAKTVRKEADIQWRHKSTGGHMLGLESIRPNNKGIGGDTKSPSSRNRSPNCIRKTKKYVLWNAGICLSQFPNSVKNCFSTQNFIESGQSAAD